MELQVIDFGVSPYREIWKRQKRLQSSLVDCKRNKSEIVTEFLMVGEHHPVFTLGFHGNSGNMLAGEETLAARGIECIRVERGGDITYHGPGQLIVYPIVDLISHGLGVKAYISLLEDSVIELLGRYGINGEKVEGATGIWLGKESLRERKICAIGVKVTRGVTMHGLSLNVNNSLEPFSWINPCGFVDKGVTSLSLELEREVSMDELKRELTGIILRNLT